MGRTPHARPEPTLPRVRELYFRQRRPGAKERQLANRRDVDERLEQSLANIRHRSPEQRAQAIAYLAGLGPLALRAVGPLAAALSDPVAAVRQMAAVALAEMGPEARSAVPELARALEDGD